MITFAAPVLDSGAASRFWAKVDKSNDCWLWTATKNERGYGRFTVPVQGKDRAQPVAAHRVAYLLANGELPATHLDHTCRNRSCVRPDHLEPVSHVENLRRGGGRVGMGLRAKAAGVCVHGHVLAVVGTYGKRSRCKECARIRARAA